jgi:cation:H+ antiporter
VTLPTLLILVGVALLYMGAEALVRGASRLSWQLGVSPIMVGLTVVSIGTSAPELVVCILAALDGSPDLAVGNVFGSNLANVGLVLGITALVRPLQVASPVIRRDIPWMLGVTLLAFPLMLNLWVGRLEGLVLALALGAYLVYLARIARRQGHLAVLGTPLPQVEEEAQMVTTEGTRRSIGFVVIGCIALTAGGQFVVVGGTHAAEILAIPQLLVGLSVIAVGTSLPELAATSVAAARGEADLAVGNIVGSNVFNLTIVLGGTAIVRPLAIPEGVLRVEYPAVFLLSLMLLPLALNQRKIGRGEGAVLLLLYVVSWIWIGSAIMGR